MDPATAYDVAIEMTKAVIDEADPDGLLEAGAPDDEYDDYVAEIARRLLHGEDPRLILDLWQEWPGVRDRDWCIERLSEVQAAVLERP